MRKEDNKRSSKLVDSSGSPPSLLLLSVQFIIYILSCLSIECLQWMIPVEAANAQHPDNSALLDSHWYEPV
jgi:hypothetical protein